jgi:prevent-host-death family protein
MPTIPQKELRNNIGEILRRVEAGEEFIVTVAGRPVAELTPAKKRQFVGGAALRRIWETPTPQTLEKDRERFGSGLGLSDPWARSGEEPEEPSDP